MFVYKRLKAGGETRLHDKLSIGVGGHMNDLSEEDKELIPNYGFTTIVTDNLERELDEELLIICEDRQLEIFGLLNDDSDDVGKVHLGLLVVIDLSAEATVEVKEKDQLEGEWVKTSLLYSDDIFSRLENWSKISLQALESGGEIR
ncbi:hypothetical protein D3C72_1171650 [compost metagenome]